VAEGRGRFRKYTSAGHELLQIVVPGRKLRGEE
jgi:hypothetical protein